MGNFDTYKNLKKYLHISEFIKNKSIILHVLKKLNQNEMVSFQMISAQNPSSTQLAKGRAALSRSQKKKM